MSVRPKNVAVLRPNPVVELFTHLVPLKTSKSPSVVVPKVTSLRSLSDDTPPPRQIPLTATHPFVTLIFPSKVEVAPPVTASCPFKSMVPFTVSVLVASDVPMETLVNAAAAAVVNPMEVLFIRPPEMVSVDTISESVTHSAHPARARAEASVSLLPPPPLTFAEIIGALGVPVIVIFFPATSSFTTFEANTLPSPKSISAPSVTIPPKAEREPPTVAVFEISTDESNDLPATSSV